MFSKPLANNEILKETTMFNINNHMILNERLQKYGLEAPGIDPGTSRMLSERSTI